MLSVKDYILIWTIFKLYHAFIINNDRRVEEGEKIPSKDSISEFIKNSKNVLTSLDEGILKSNKVLDEIASDSSKMDRMSGFEDQQIKQIEDQLDSKALGNLGSAQLTDENVIQLNQDSSLKIDQTTAVQGASKKNEIVAKNLQGLYKQVFSHISFQESTNSSLRKNSSTKSSVKNRKTTTAIPESVKERYFIILQNVSETSTNKQVSHIEIPSLNPVKNFTTSTAQLVSNKESSFDHHSYPSTTQSLSYSEISSSIGNYSGAFATKLLSNLDATKTSLYRGLAEPTSQPVTNKIMPMTSLFKHSATTAPAIDASLKSLNSLSEAPTLRQTSDKEILIELPEFLGSRVVPVHHNVSQICIDIGDICNSNETRDHIKSHFEENPDDRAKTDNPPPPKKVFTATTTTQKSIYPNSLTLLKPSPPLKLNKSADIAPLSTLAHLEFLGQITCHWICESKNVKDDVNSTNKQVHHACADRKRKSFVLHNDVLYSTTVDPSVIKTTNDLKMQQVAYDIRRYDPRLGDVQNSTCSTDENSTTPFFPEGITMICTREDFRPTFEICSTSKTTVETCESSETSMVTEEHFTTTNTPEVAISESPETIPDEITDSPEISDLPEELNMTIELSHLSTEGVSISPEQDAMVGGLATIQSTKLERYVHGSSEKIGGLKSSPTKRSKKWSLLIPVCLFSFE